MCARRLLEVSIDFLDENRFRLECDIVSKGFRNDVV